KELNGRGVVYCATCDAPLFKGKDVAVVGGGNAAFETALQLTSYAAKIYILIRGSQFKGDPVIQEKVLSSSKVTSLTDTQVEEIKGQEYVAGLVYGNLKNGEKKEIAVEGIFVEIGSVPNSDMVKGLCETNGQGEVIIDHKTARTSVEGIWAAGDVTDQLYKQNNISMGYAVTALEDVYLWLQNWKEETGVIKQSKLCHYENM
ncbi:MAG: FAD-dependent oxidoreductase, partial [Firmicutes bacterium]|nr:FAD-dependent oxidoreductase [Bacillota bacterium]